MDRASVAIARQAKRIASPRILMCSTITEICNITPRKDSMTVLLDSSTIW
jgi:hypothetical protein